MKKAIALLSVLAMLLSFAACDNGTEKETTEALADSSVSVTETTVEDSADETVQNTEVISPTAEGTTAAASETTTEAATGESSDDPSTWTNEEIVEFYKNAAIKSKTKVKSIQTMTMTEMVVNDGDGLIGTLVEWATPIMKAALKRNSTEFDGITGGYEKLTVADTQSIKAYKSGEHIVIEMTLKEQTDGIHGDTYSGTVGHAISVVGDISSVAAELPQFNIDFENSNLKMRYANPKLKVKINKDGIIEKGSWSYIVDVDLTNLYIEAVKLPIKVMIDSGYGSVDYLITVGGGF